MCRFCRLTPSRPCSTPPLRAGVAAALSVTAVPVAAAVATGTGSMSVPMTGEEFFFYLVFPYGLVVVVAFVGAITRP